MVWICWNTFGRKELHNSGEKIRCHERFWHRTFLPSHLSKSTRVGQLTGFTFHTDELPIRERWRPQALQVEVLVALSLTRNQRVTRAFTDLQHSKQQWFSDGSRRQNHLEGLSPIVSDLVGGGTVWGEEDKNLHLQVSGQRWYYWSWTLTVGTTELGIYFHIQYGIKFKSHT